jgi:Tfp pilus assembly protein PilO
VVFSKRERVIAVTSAAVLAVIVIQQVVIGPLWERKKQLNALIETAQSQRDRDAILIATSERAGKYWSEMSRRGLPRDNSDADQMFSSLSDWAQEARLSLSSVKAERTEKDKDFYRKSFRATGGGAMAQIGQFLYKIQTAPGAVRITDLTLSSRHEGTDDLSLSVAVTTIFPVPESEKLRATASVAEVSR